MKKLFTMKLRIILLSLVLFLLSQTGLTTIIEVPESIGANVVMIGGVTPVAGAATNYCNDANCQLCLYMNANGGNETDRSANAYSALETGGTIPSSATVPSGYAGTSRDFEADDTEYLLCNALSCPNLSIAGANQPISLVAWIKNEAITDAADQIIMGKYIATGSNRSYLLGMSASPANTFGFWFYLSSDGGSTNKLELSSTGTSYTSGTWYHIAAVYNDTDLRIYVNGSLDCTPGTYSLGIFDSGNQAWFLVGAKDSTTTTDYFDGLIDEVGVFNRALTSAEVANIYNNGISGNKGGSD